MLHDGPYIFIKQDRAHAFTIRRSPETKNIEIEKEEIPLYRLPDHVFTTAVDYKKEGMNISRFSFKVKTDTSQDTLGCVYDQPDKLLVTSDIEGNFHALSKILSVNKVINKDGDWIFGTNHLLINGDLIDRSNNVLPCLWLIYKLEYQAKESGGAVHFILGNHELMNFKADFRYVHPKYTSSAKMLELYNALFDHSSVLGNWIRTKNAMEKIGDYLFVHGGISKMLIQRGLTIKQINAIIQDNLNKQTVNLTDDLERLVTGDNGPLWYRGMILREYGRSGFNEKDVDEILSYFNAAKIVAGHTVVPRFKKLYNGKLIAIDIELPGEDDECSLQAILIEDGKEFIVDYKGDRKLFNMHA